MPSCLVTWVATKGPVFLPARVSDPVKGDWQNQVLAASGYRELGMFHDAAQALEDIEPEERTRKEHWCASPHFKMAAQAGADSLRGL